MDPAGTLGKGDCSTVDDNFVGKLKGKCPSMFHVIRKLKYYQLNLHVDPYLTPVVQKMRLVTFSLKDKVTAKLMSSMKRT